MAKGSKLRARAFNPVYRPLFDRVDFFGVPRRWMLWAAFPNISPPLYDFYNLSDRCHFVTSSPFLPLGAMVGCTLTV